MTLLYDQYRHHLQTGQSALQAGRYKEARRELLLASRCLLRLAGESDAAEMRQARKQKGLKLLQMAQSMTADGRADHKQDADPPADAAESSGNSSRRWEVLEKPGVHFAEIAGLEEVKSVIERRLIGPLRNPDLARQYRRQVGGGVLMYGPPGTGKTLMAKAIATELEARFYNVSCSDIMSKWVGEAEQNLHALMQEARSRPPAVIFLDETEALIGKRGGQSTVMNRLIPEFLAQIDGLRTGSGGLLLLGATNRPWDLDPAALRHGRFGEHIYVGLPDEPARRFMLEQMLDGVPVAEDVDLGEIARRSDGLTGADLQGLVNRMIDPAFEQALQSGQAVAVSHNHAEEALQQTRLSVSDKELTRYQRFSSNRE